MADPQKPAPPSLNFSDYLRLADRRPARPAPPPEPEPPVPAPAPGLKPELPFETLPSDKPWSRWAAEQLHVAPALDATQRAVDNAGRWFRSHLLGMSPEDEAHWLQESKHVDEVLAANAQKRQANWTDFKKDLWASGPGQRLGPVLEEQYGKSLTPSAQTKAVAEYLRSGLTERSDATRAALPTAPTELDWGALAPGFAKARTGDPLDKGRSTVDPLKPLDWMAGAQHDWIPKFLVDTAESSATPAGALMNFGDVGPVLHGAGALAAKLGVGAHLAAALPPGFYSRVEKIAETVSPTKGIHPNKLASLLKSGASGEEVAYRKLPEFIASRGNSLIGRDELAAHLAAHPAPDIGRTVLGASTDPAHVHAAREVLANRHLLVDDPLTTLQQAYPRASESALRDALDAAQDPNYPAGPAKYSSYTLPGGENYRESLTQLAERPSEELAQLTLRRDDLTHAMSTFDRPLHTLDDLPTDPDQIQRWVDEQVAERRRYKDEYTQVSRRIAELQAAAPAPYPSPHFDQPNILVHARTTERALPPAPMRSLPEVEQIIQDTVGAKRPEHIASGGPQAAVRQGLITHDEAAAYGHSRGFTNYPHAPTGPRGRFIEETQSDWNQTGRREGYQDPDKTAALAAAHARETALEQERAALQPLLSAAHEADDPAYYELSRRRNDLGSALAQARIERRALEGGGGVPDNPFKETWPDLALKQQLLDVANRQDLSWLGFTSGKTQAARYDLAKQVSRLEYDPIDRRLLAYDHDGQLVLEEATEPEGLAEYIGKEPAEKLAQKITEHEQSRAYDRAQWSTEIDPESGQFLIVDPNGEVMHDHGGTPLLHETEREAHQHIDDLVNNEYDNHSQPRPRLEGLDLQVGGEGMTHFYDQLLPKRLQKLVAPFGGTVEKGALPITKEVTEDVPGFSVRDNFGHMRGWWPTREEAEAYIANPPPQMTSYVSAAAGARVVPAEGGKKVMKAVAEPAWIAHLSPDMKERIRRQGFPLLSTALLAGGAGAAASQLGGDDDGQGGIMGGINFAAVAPIMLGGRRPMLNLERTLKYLGDSRYALKPAVIDRLAALYERGRALAPKATWGGTEHPELLAAFGGDSDLARQWARFFGTTSAGTSVPKNTQESIAALTHALDRPGVPFEASGFAPDVNGRLRSRLALYDTVITNAESKLDSLNRALAGLEPSGPKTEAMSQFMQGLPRSPIDRHILWGLGSAHDTLNESHQALKTLMQKVEGLGGLTGRGRDQLNEHKVYSRLEQAIADALQGLDPERPYNPLFGDAWEGARAAKDLGYAGGPIDILRARDLLGANFLTDADRLKYALRDPSASWAAPLPTRASFYLRHPY